jgi:hypothetical protein
MNPLESTMVELLRRMKGDHGLMAVKAEFEAEGTRTEELMRLKDIALAADVDLVLKIGGCDAVRDMHDARSIGIQHLVAPMVESSFALQKYLWAVEQNFPKDERDHIGFFVNVETVDTVEVLEELFTIPEIHLLEGIVLGRGDLVESMGLPRTAVDDDKILAIATGVLTRVKELGFTTVMGGGINLNSVGFLRALPQGCLDRFETRKICFNCQEALRGDTEAAIENALRFEFHWLENKHQFYKRISEEDDKRIGLLRKRFTTNA